MNSAMTLNEYNEMKKLIHNIELKIDNINKEIKKLPKDYVNNHLKKLYILGDDVLDYPNNTKNGKFRTHDAVVFQKSFPFFGYKCYIKWGCTFRKTWFDIDDSRLYNEKINLHKLDIESLEKLSAILINILNSLKEETNDIK